MSEQEVKLHPQTIVLDILTKRVVLTIDGVLTLPIGATLDLHEPERLATVTGVSLFCARHSPAQVCLEVQVNHNE